MKKLLATSILFYILTLSVIAQEKKVIDNIHDLYKSKIKQSDNPTLLSNDTITTFLIQLKTFEKTPKGTEVVKYISPSYMIVRASAKTLGSNQNISNYTLANANWKASDVLMAAYAAKPSKPIPVKAAIKGLSNWQKYGQVTDAEKKGYLYISIDVGSFNSFLEDPNVLFADLVRAAKEEMIINDIDLASNRISTVHALLPNINGQGVHISVKEDQYDNTDIDFMGKLLPNVKPSETQSTHATTMATLMAGNGNSFIKGLGAAPAAMITSVNFKTLNPDDIASYASNAVTVQNHSYGTGVENVYGIEANAYDDQIATVDTLVHVFSAGNSGNITPTLGMYSGVSMHANLTGNFKQAKNVLIVGGTNLEYIVEGLSSKGPAYDGRVKPDLVASGEDGTSGAAALGSGVVALLQQQYRVKKGKAPSTALIKSILLNSADELPGSPISYEGGYGIMNAHAALKTIIENRFMNGKVAQQQELTFPIQINGPLNKLKVTLAWNDPAASINAASALVNDLDLWVEDTNGNKILPWVLNPYPNLDSLKKPAIRKRDSINNAELVSLDNCPAGTYTIHVRGKLIPQGEQTFYIAYQATPKDAFEWIFPATEDQLFGGENNYLRWTSSFSTANGSVSVSTDNGSTWQAVGTVADVNKGFLLWNTPNQFTRAIAKMTVNNKDYISAPFTISKALTMTVGYNCADGVMLQWNKQPNATAYQLYTITNNKLVPYLTPQTDNMVRIDKAAINSRYYAVSAIGPGGFEGLKSYTIDYQTQGVQCYVQQLLADPTANRTIDISLILASTLGLRKIYWEKLTAPDTYTRLGETLVVQGTFQYKFTDTAPKEGLQFYRVVIERETGQQIPSDPVSAILVSSNNFALYPNPVHDNLNILSGTQANYQVDFYDTMGRKVMNESINDFQQSISLLKLSAGVYICVIRQNDKVLYRTKLIKV